MPPREATNPFPDQYLTLDYESAGPIVLPHDGGGGAGEAAGAGLGGGPVAGEDVPPSPGGAADVDSDDSFGEDQQQHVPTQAGVDQQAMAEEHDPVSEAQDMEVASEEVVGVDPLGVTDAGDITAARLDNPSGGGGSSIGVEIPPPPPASVAASPSQPVIEGSSSRLGETHRERNASDVVGGDDDVDPLSIDTTPAPSAPPPQAWLTSASVGQPRGIGTGGSLTPNHPGYAPLAFAHQINSGSGGPGMVTPPGSLPPNMSPSSAAASVSSGSTSGDSTAPLSMGSPLPSSAPVSPLTPGDGLGGVGGVGGLSPSGVPLPIATSLVAGTNVGPGEVAPSTPHHRGRQQGRRSMGLGQDQVQQHPGHAQQFGQHVASAAGSPVVARASTNELLLAYQQGLLPAGPQDASSSSMSSPMLVQQPPPAPQAPRRFRRSHHHRAHPHQLFSSVLDNSTTLDSDDEDEVEDEDDNGLDQGFQDYEFGSQTPGLDTTNISDSTEDLADDEAEPCSENMNSRSNAQAISSSTHRQPHVVSDEDGDNTSDSSSFYGTPATGAAFANRSAAHLHQAVTQASGPAVPTNNHHRGRASTNQSEASANSSGSPPGLHSSAAFDQGSPGGAAHGHREQFHARQAQSQQQAQVRAHSQQAAYYRLPEQQQPRHAGQAYNRQVPQGPHSQLQQQRPLPVPRRTQRLISDSSGSQQPIPNSNNGANGASSLALSFGPSTTISDLTYFAERGCIVPLLGALTTPRLRTLGARMLADYAKMSARRVAVAGNARILEFLRGTVLEDPLPAHLVNPSGPGSGGGASCSAGGGMGVAAAECDQPSWETSETGPGWPAREYAVEAVRSLTATEESDGHLMSCPGLLRALAVAASGGPFVSVRPSRPPTPPPSSDLIASERERGLVQLAGAASPKARLHACIAVMNLSCGKSNKVEIAAVPEVLAGMRDVMLGLHFPPRDQCADGGKVRDEARLKAVTCVKNLSNADANDAALLGCPGLVEALGRVALAASREQAEGVGSQQGAATCTTNACLALMNLSISKANKHRVFRTPGVMDALMAVITCTCPSSSDRAHQGGQAQTAQARLRQPNDEARVKACSALSNLAIGYDNKIPMFAYPGFVDSILRVIEMDDGEARTKACSILWSFAAEMKNQVPVVQRGDILPALVRVANLDGTTEARFKCVAALTLLAESLENAIPLLEAGALEPLMEILRLAGPDPTQWKGQTASWCVGFLMNIAQADGAVPCLREAGVVELLAPLLTLDHYQSLKAAMAVTFVCRYDEDDDTYDLLRKTENVIPKIISLLHNTLSGRGGNGYKYGVFTLRSSVGCISSLASGPDFTKERIATPPVFESLLRVLSDFCVDGGTDGAIVGGGRDDALSATLAMRAVQGLVTHLIPVPGSSSLPFGPSMDERLLEALESFERSGHPEISDETRRLATDAKVRILGCNSRSSNPLSSCQGGGSAAMAVSAAMKHMTSRKSRDSDEDMEDASSAGGPASIAASIASSCCGAGLPTMGELEDCFPSGFPSMIGATLEPAAEPHPPAQNPPPLSPPDQQKQQQQEVEGLEIIDLDETSASSAPSVAISAASASTSDNAIRTFLLSDSVTGRRFAVPTDPSGGRAFNTQTGPWCYRRGRFCHEGEVPDPNYVWTRELQESYIAAIRAHSRSTSGLFTVLVNRTKLE